MMNFLISAFKSLPTPFYYYDLELLKANLAALKKASSPEYIVHYALKANANDKILATIKNAGIGADCVSGNEVKKAVEAGFKANEIAFAGVGKSDEEILTGLKSDIFCFNSESAEELKVINELAAKYNKIARIALRINPNVHANTHKYITTGLEENKFGINLWELDSVMQLIKNCSNLKLIGIHFHIGSQINDLSNFKNLCTKSNEIQQWFEERNYMLEHINVGGGLGVDYHHPDDNSVPDYKGYFEVFDKFLELRKEQKLHFELGRAIVAQCGSLISKVLYVKKGVSTSFVILDAGMTELIRPALYQSYHKIENISTANDQFSIDNSHKYDVVGPICESSDCFGKAVMLPETNRGDLFAIRTTGAYGEVMSSNYNLREKAKAVYSDEL
ncbi:MAG: Diaminopimelate decarboxylase [Bacteroidia bacterium]|nr:Diaminopimelate decarboxylase [Bacteroidia bacterium]